MDILVIAATDGEIAPILGREYTGKHRIDFLVTGIGMTATAYRLGYALREYRPDLLLNVGVCGSFDRTYALGGLVRITKDTFAELGAEDGHAFLNGEALGFGSCTFSERIEGDYPALDGLPTVDGITVNTVHGHTESIDGILARLSPAVESMEGAAVFYAAYQERIQCLQVRAISNYVERRNRSNWQLEKAIANLNDWLGIFLDRLPV